MRKLSLTQSQCTGRNSRRNRQTPFPSFGGGTSSRVVGGKRSEIEWKRKGGIVRRSSVWSVEIKGGVGSPSKNGNRQKLET